MRIAERWWQTGPCQKLAALSSTIQAEQHPGEHETEEEYKARHERELAKWRDKSPGLLPAGAFIFKDEFEQIYSNEFKYGYYHFKGDDGKFLSEPDHIKRIALDYLPFVDDATAALVLAGFENYQTPNNGTSRAHTNSATVSQVTPMQVPELEQVPPNSPVVNAGARSGTATVWTEERKNAARAMLNELRGKGIKAFAANTATAFGVTATRVREVLNDKPKKAPARKAKGVWDV